MRNYLLVFSDRIGTSQYVSSLLNRLPIVEHWRYDMSHAILIKSHSSANELYKALKELVPIGRFFITEISSDNRQGYMSTKSWEFIKN